MENASETVPPTIGTALPIISFAVFEKLLSAEEDIMVPSPIIPEKTVMEKVRIHIAKFLNDFAISPMFTSETEPAMLIARKILIIGAIISPEIRDTTVAVPSIRELKAVAVVIYPEAIIAEE